MLMPLLLLALAAQRDTTPPPILTRVHSGLVCPSRPVTTDSTQLVADGCTPTTVLALDPQGRELWFLANVTIDRASQEPLAITMGAVASSEVYWDDVLLGRNGTPGASRAAERPGMLDLLMYLPPEHSRPGAHVLLVHMSGFHGPVRLARPVHYLMVTTYAMAYGGITPYYVPAIMMTGALLIAIAYFGGAWLFRRRDRRALMVVLMATSALGQLVLELWRVLWPLPYPWHAWRLVGIQALATIFALALVAYVTNRFAVRWRLPALVGTLLVPLLTSWVPGYDLWTLLTLSGAIVIALMTTGPAAWRREPGARSMVAAFVFFLVLGAVDTWGFVDRGFYLGTAALAMLLLREQWRVGQDAHERERDARRQVEQLEAQLLRRRFAPHWLLNTLNALTDWIESDPPTAVRLIEALGEEYHMVADASGKRFIPLSDEIALCRKHLQVMSLRVDRAFHLECHGCDPQLPVPPGILQTLIENAFSHGRYAAGAVFVLRQTAHEGGALLELRTPPAIDAESEAEPLASTHPSSGHHRGEGLAYVRAQLRQAFGDPVAVTDGPVTGGGWRTQLTLGGAP